LSRLEIWVPLALPVQRKCRNDPRKHWQSQWHPTPKSSIDKALVPDHAVFYS
jgi:hypothetical protein